MLIIDYICFKGAEFVTFREKYVTQLLESIFEVPVRILEYPFSFFSKFHMEIREKLLLSANISADDLQKELLAIPFNRIFYLKSAIGYINIFLRLAESGTSKVLHIGPFLEEDFSQSYLARVIREGGFSDTQTQWFLSYFSSLPVISEQRILCVLTTVLTNEISDFENEDIIFHDFQPFEPLELQNFSNHEQQLTKDYHEELLQTHHTFFHALQIGDFKTVYKHLSHYLAGIQSIQNTSFYSNIHLLHDFNTACRMTFFSTPVNAYNTHQTWTKCALGIQNKMESYRINDLAEWIIEEYALLYKTYGYKDYSPIIRETVKYIHNNIEYTTSLQEVAEHLNRNKSTLSRQFKEEVGETFSQYVQRIKIEATLEKILQAKDSIQEISLSVGFEDQAYFNRVFHKIMGCSPTHYRSNWHAARSIAAANH